jgi:hypothetical protein
MGLIGSESILTEKIEVPDPTGSASSTLDFYLCLCTGGIYYELYMALLISKLF